LRLISIKVLFVSIYDIFQPSGPGNHIRCLSEALTRLGCEIHILTPGKQTKSVKTNGLIIHYIKTRSFSSGFLFSLISIGWTQEIVKKYQIDIVHGQSPSSFGYALFSRNKKPYIVTLHGTSFGELVSLLNVPLSSVTFGLLKDALFIQPLSAFLTAIEYRFADKIISVSDSITRETRQYYRIPRAKIVTVHNGVNVSKDFTRVIKPDNNYTILLVGRLIWRKGVKYLIESLPTVLTAYPNVKLYIVGNGEQKSYLQKLVKMLNLESSVEFLGFVSNERISSLFAEADIYVQPSLYEPFSIAILEAMGAGLPLVVSRVGGIPELVINKKDGLVVDPCDTSQLSQALITLLSNSSLRKLYGDSGKDKVINSLSWEKIAEKTLEIYKELNN
jgi:glycogen synthase